MRRASISISKDVFDAMIEHCKEGLPNEACGFLAGKDGHADRIYPLINQAASPVFYKPDGKQMIAAMNDIDDTGSDLIAIFHSHVASAPLPSPTDVREAHYPDAVYLIVSLKDLGSIEAKGFFIEKKDWRDAEGEVLEVALVIS
ncbi:MAG: Mov34/MPN/PAD-1 family protein [Actinomycetota bacterium]|nr:M67 family metallopeptidase [Actinomycetota bacterium]